MVLMIDNYDSFTYNVVQYCQELGANLKVVRNDEISIRQIKKLNVEKIIISPGPSNPDNAGISLKVIEEFRDVLPILGICLGNQAIAQSFGATIVKAKNMMHGKTSKIEIIKEDALLKGVKSGFISTRYHSLSIDKDSLTDDIVVTSYSMDDDEIMSLHIKNRDIYGVQFHPESIMSENGKDILNNFLRL